jgi:hypothetical protein
MALLFAAGMFMGGSRSAVSAQTDVLLQGRYVFVDKSDDTDPRHYLIFDAQTGVLKEWSDHPDSLVYTYEFDSPRDIRLSTTTVRR